MALLTNTIEYHGKLSKSNHNRFSNTQQYRVNITKNTYPNTPDSRYIAALQAKYTQ
ncbi:hypothetical protein LguiB_001480 [Lonicera macranthoides]